MRKYWGLLISICLLFSCSSQSPEEKAMLKEAYELQSEVIKGIKELKSTPFFNNKEEPDSLLDVLHEMEEALFAIPGYHLALPGHEGHDHGESRISLTTKEILDVQHELLKQVNNLKSTYQSND